MKQRFLTMTAIMAGFVSPTGAIAVPPGVNMLPVFESSRTHEFEYSIRSTLKMSAFGSDQTTQSHMEARLTLQVLDEEPAEGLHAVGLTYTQLKISFEGGQLPGAFDSANPKSTDAGNVYAEICRPILNQQIRLIVDRAGTIESIDGLDQLAPEGLAGILFNQLFGEEAAKAMFQPLIRVVDDPQQQRHRAPDSWELKRPAIASLGVPESSLKLQMKSGDNPRDIAIIDLSGEPKATMPSEAAMLPNITTKKAELTGRLRWNGELGVLESLDTESVTQMESSAQGIAITVDATSTTRVKRVQ